MDSRRKHYVIKKRDIIIFLSFFVLIGFAFTIDLTDYIIPKSKVLTPVILLLSLLVVFKLAKTRFVFSKMDILVFCMIIFIWFRNANLEYGAYKQFEFCVSFLLLYIIARRFDEWHMIAMKITLIFGLFYAFMTFLCMMVPSFYKGFVLPLFQDVGYNDLMLRLYNEGYQSGFTPHYSTNAIYLTGGLFLPVAFILTKSKEKNKQILFFVFIAVALLLTGKRAHIIFAFSAILVTYYFLHSNEKKTRLFKILIGISGVLSTYIIACELFPSLGNVVLRFSEAYNSGSFDYGRGDLRAFALTLFADHPLLGIGWDGFKYIYRNLYGVVLNAHCVYVQLLCEVGLIGSILFFSFFAINLIRIVKVVKYYTNHKTEFETTPYPIVSSLFYQVFFLLYGITGTPLYESSCLILYIISCSIGEFYYRKYVKQHVKQTIT